MAVSHNIEHLVMVGSKRPRDRVQHHAPGRAEARRLAYRPNGTAPSREPLPEPPPKSLHHNLEDLARRLEAERTLTLSTPRPEDPVRTQ